MAKNILKEAIADAKAVREVALANAKAALEEAFTPKIQSMLSAKLSEDLDEEYYEEDMENEAKMKMGKDDPMETYYEEDMDEDMDEMMYDEDMDEDMDEMMYDEDMDEDMDEGHMDGHGMEEEMDEEIDLEELLNELELEEDEAIVDENEEILDELGRPIYKAEEANYAGYTADRVHESEEFDLDSLLKEINDLEEDKQTDKVTPPNLDKVLAERGLPKKEVMYCKEEKANIQELVQQLDESRTALNTNKGELNEVNLLNSKLLYVNRIFKANNLDDSQKLRVVETLDNAGTIKEAKLIYETIKDTFNVAKTTKTTPKKSIREGLGMASKATGTSTAPRKAILNESNDMVTRMQKLANITINE